MDPSAMVADMQTFASLVARQEAIMKSQEQSIISLTGLVKTQKDQIEQQNEIIKKLAADCELIGRNSVAIAKKVADKEIKKFKHVYVKDVKDLKDRVEELDNQNKNLKTLAVGVTAVAVVCISMTVSPYVLVLL
jgi:hypothetical protein